MGFVIPDKALPNATVHRRDFIQNYSGFIWHEHKVIKAINTWLQTFEVFIADQYLEVFFRQH